MCFKVVVILLNVLLLLSLLVITTMTHVSGVLKGSIIHKDCTCMWYVNVLAYV